MLLRRIVVFFQLSKPQLRAVVHGDLHRRSRIVIHVDLFEVRNETDFVQRLFVVLHVFVRLRRAIVIVKRHAGRDDIQHHRPLVCNRGFQHGAELPLVARERPAYERRAQLHGKRASVDWGQIIDDAALQF